VVRSRTVDSTPMRVGPESRMASIFPLRSVWTCWAVVGLGLPARFALGAAMGQLLCLMSAKATGWLGILTATVSRPATVMSGMVFERLKMRVSGPGQNFCMSFSAFGGIWVVRVWMVFVFSMWMMGGLSNGLFFAWNRAWTAFGFRASAPKP